MSAAVLLVKPRLVRYDASRHIKSRYLSDFEKVTSLCLLSSQTCSSLLCLRVLTARIMLPSLLRHFLLRVQFSHPNQTPPQKRFCFFPPFPLQAFLDWVFVGFGSSERHPADGCGASSSRTMSPPAGGGFPPRPRCPRLVASDRPLSKHPRRPHEGGRFSGLGVSFH